MALNSFLVATQGFAFSSLSIAPFAFSPIAIAVQGLIDEIREERVNGGGGSRGRTSAPAQSHAAKPDVSEAEVRAQWELLELRQQPSPAKEPGAKRKPGQRPRRKQPKAAVQPQAADPSDDEEALLLLLAALAG